MEFTVNKSKIATIFDLPKLGMTNQLEQYEKEDSLWKNTIPVVNNQYIFGLELETENVQDKFEIGTIKHRGYWSRDIDNSLRNYGKEFISVPLKAFQLEHALDQLTSLYNVKKLEWSERTSTHVHVNARDLTLEQILGMILVYCAVEKVLFKWVGHNRDKNIFCIPLYKTWYYRNIGNFTTDAYSIARNWNKYTALNLNPLQKYGTIEFRHLYGTWDKEVILQWTNLISCIKRYSKNKTVHEIKTSIFDLNTSSVYNEFILNVFKSHANILLADIKDEEELQSLMEEPVAFCKLCLAAQGQGTRAITTVGAATIFNRRPITQAEADEWADNFRQATPNPFPAWVQLAENHGFDLHTGILQLDYNLGGGVIYRWLSIAEQEEINQVLPQAMKLPYYDEARRPVQYIILQTDNVNSIIQRYTQWVIREAQNDVTENPQTTEEE